jgi:hypothetical protein
MAQRPIQTFFKKLVSPKKKREAEAPAAPGQVLVPPSLREETGEISEIGYITPTPSRPVSEAPVGPELTPRRQTAWKSIKNALSPSKRPFIRATIAKTAPTTTQAAKLTGAGKSKTVNISNAELIKATPSQLLAILETAYQEKSKFIC